MASTELLGELHSDGILVPKFLAALPQLTVTIVTPALEICALGRTTMDEPGRRAGHPPESEELRGTDD